ncbi:uncharacterized protein LOC124936691 [Impatiens glandulifera]|uniref:uncharacterized protein LOC124936681 n=1 Tax=Impatiens glandulifera TaxID=253017 RepID=UPI001FB07564|nr:uncharacterized protein LOC124936681 [Impatiens glandulifera]XP_047333168.1 uncharacterized protein LOC124936691 [Impatiens glandulifera]
MMNIVAMIFAFGTIVVAHLLPYGFTYATTTFMNFSKPKGTLKTIKSDNGDVIDCIDIYKQIAFDNPLIKSLQLNLYLDKQMKIDNSLPENKLVQGWHRNGKCPFQTVPILRTLKNQFKSFQPFPAIKYADFKKHEHAAVWNKKGEYHGTSAKFSVSNPRTEKNDFSLSQLWLASGLNTLKLNSIEAGWTRDSYGKTGCYNLRCPGFVQTSQTFALGSPLELPISTHDKKSSDIQISIYKVLFDLDYSDN